MSQVRQRRLRDDTVAAPSTASTRRSPQRSLKRVFLLLIVFALCLIYFTGLLSGQGQLLDGIAKSLGYEVKFHHAVIIDAGSSGSRVLAYKFRVPFSVFGKGSLDLVEEYFEQSKPGLSSFADDPVEGAGTIVRLIKNAEHLTPPDKRRSTPLIVRATAGLRLLPLEKANELIQHVKDAISKLGYDVASNAVEIMEGSDEGIYIWYTVNLLHDTLDSYESMAALDLGGGSTQITYRLIEKEVKEVPPGDLYEVPSRATNLTVFTHSYLKLGLLAARYGILRMEAGDTATKNFTSICVDPIVQNEPWVYANQQYYVSGAPRTPQPKASWSEKCRSLVKRYIMDTLDWEPSHPPRGSVAAMSYYYDIAADAGIIDVATGGSMKVKQYATEAARACTNSNVEQPWACLDLVYVGSLLHDALKIDLSQTISLYKKVNGHEVSWALGLAYTTVLEKLQAES